MRRIRMISDGTRLIREYSDDDGVTWHEFPRPTVTDWDDEITEEYVVYPRGGAA